METKVSKLIPIAVMAMFPTIAAANDGIYTQVGLVKYKLNNLWRQNGYASNTETTAPAYSLGYQWDGKIPYRVGLTVFGEMEEHSLFNGDSDHLVGTGPTVMAAQKGNVFGIEAMIRPEIDFGWFTAHSNIGFMLYRAKWEAYAYSAYNPTDTGWSATWHMESVGVTPVLGFGFQRKNVTVDFNFYKDIAADGKQYKSIGGGGGYDAGASVMVGVRF